MTTSKVLQNSVVNSDDSFTLPNVDKADDLLAHGKDDGVDGNNVDDDDADAEPLVLHKHNGNLAYIIFHYECFGYESALSRVLYKNVRVFCWIMTSLNNTFTRAIHVNATWAPRCNKYVFITSEESSGLPTVKLNATEGRKFLWMKTKEAFKWIYNNELQNYDWFLKADDDTFVIVENLRFMLLAYSPDAPIYFGCKFKMYMKQGYMSGGAGYVLSREAVKRFVEDGLTDSHKCKASNTGAEDAEIGKCLQNVGVIAGDSRDGREEKT
ncbi:unnamed protein product [Enterobius vermicularis]|uniref:Glycoprotein-N-acetylgalactosamine 3-beta-galactosyltransferase 1 n=1 Tax=Enterobius vermicularis TaxID=51028 RepID=A0A3P6J8G8_ENTVE|nr:unnamed protein product [Enterobius vermicularis]